MSNSPSVFIDTSFFKAFIDINDEFHTKAISIWKKMQEQSSSLVTSNYILDESFTLIRIRCGRMTAEEFRELLARSGSLIKIVRVTTQDEAEAWKWFTKDWSGLSFTDCVSFALMKRLEITYVATFDQDFTREGFKQLEEKG